MIEKPTLSSTLFSYNENPTDPILLTNDDGFPEYFVQNLCALENQLN